ACGAQMGRQFRQLRAAVEIPLLRDLSADEPALHLHGRLAARARALLPARRHACGGRLVPAGRARARVLEAGLLELSARGAACAAGRNPHFPGHPAKIIAALPSRSAVGTSRTSRDVRLESAKWSKADVGLGSC